MSELPEVVSMEQWQSELAAHRAEEKALTRAKDALAAKRRRLPMVKIDKDYDFLDSRGSHKLTDLFEGRKQLIVYHFMFAPSVHGWPTAACPGCSWFVDSITHPAHLHARDTSIALVSLAPVDAIEGYRTRMGWSLPWYSSQGSAFNADFGVTTPDAETFGLSVFLRDGDSVFRTYFTSSRGLEAMGSHWTFLDLTVLGRQETWEDSPQGWPQTDPYVWWRRHDEY